MLYVPVSTSPVFGGEAKKKPALGGGDSLIYFPGGILIFSFINRSVGLQVEHQYSHKFTVTVKGAKNVTKGALGDMREYLFYFITVVLSFNPLTPHFFSFFNFFGLFLQCFGCTEFLS